MSRASASAGGSATSRRPAPEPAAVADVAPALAAHLRESMLRWYAVHRRDLPWRREPDAYRVWISEIMCQQTRVDTVIPYFERWMLAFPTLPSLAAANIQQVLQIWQGLGYYSRARNLHAAAQYVVTHCGGELPRTVEGLRAVPGIGPYTAGAIASIAWGQSAPLVDGNVMRVLSRWFVMDKDLRTTAAQKELWALATQLVQGPHPSEWNQSLMELGATVCSPTRPKCLLCPVVDVCGARREGLEAELPVKSAAHAVRQESWWSVRWVRPDGTELIARRRDTGLWAGLWEWPMVQVSEASLEAELGSSPWTAVGPPLVHVLSHIRMQVTPVVVMLSTLSAEPQIADSVASLYAEFRWVPSNWSTDHPASVLTRKLMQAHG